MRDDGEIRGEESVLGERGGDGGGGWVVGGWVLSNGEGRDKDGGVKAGSEIGMGDCKTHAETDG